MDTEYLKRVGLYIISAIVSLGIVIYFGYHIVSSFTPDVKTEPISESTVIKTADAEGYIFRYETPVSSTAMGSLVPSVQDGEKLGISAEAAKIYSATSTDALKRISEINDQIELLQDCTDSSTVTLKDASKFDADIYDTMTEIRLGLSSGDADIAASLKTSLITSASKKDILMGGTVDISGEIAALEAEKAQLITQLGSCLETVYTPKSGYYYSDVDGYETAFDASLLEEADFDTVKATITDARKNIADKSAGKLVTSSTWYVVCFVERGVGSLLTEGEDRDITFSHSNGLMLTMELERLVRSGDEYLCVFSTSYMPDGFDYTRSQPVKIAMAEYTGFKIRMSSVRLLGDLQGVYVLDGSTVRFRKISVITENEGYYIVETNPDGGSISSEAETGDETTAAPEGYSWLKLHDNLIVEGTGLYDGLVLGK